MVEMDGEKLMVSSSNFDDGSMIVSVGTTDFDNYGDSDFMEMMINKDGKIDYFTLPTGKGDYQRMYKIKPSHYGIMKTQNETNESAGGDFIRIDGDGKYAESFEANECSHIFGESAYQDATCSSCGKENDVYVEDDSDTTICSCGNRMNGYTGIGIDSNHPMRGKSVCERCGVYGAEGQPIYERKYRQIVVDDKLKNKLQALESIIKSLNEAIQRKGRNTFDVAETEVLRRAVSEVYFARDILMGGHWEAESFGAENYRTDNCIQCGRFNEYKCDECDLSLCEDCALTPNEVPVFSDDSAYVSETRNELNRKYEGLCKGCVDELTEYYKDDSYDAESFGAESKMCSYCKTTDLKNFSQGWDDYCMACARRHHREYGAESFGAELLTPKFKGHDKCVECGSIEIPLSEMDGGEIGLSDYYFSCAECDFSWYVAVRTDEHEDGSSAGIEFVGFMDEDGNILEEPQEFNIMGQPNPAYQKSQSESFGAETPCSVMVWKDGALTECGWWNEKNEPCVYHPDGKEINAESFSAERKKKKSGCLHFKYGKHCWAYSGNGAICVDCGLTTYIDEDGKKSYGTRSQPFKGNYDAHQAESFSAYEDPISDRQRYRISKLGGRIEKSMNRSDASRYIKSLMADPLHAETQALDCSTCQGWGWNEDLNMVCDADGCIGGWVVPKKPSLLERGLELGAGVGMGMASVAIVFGILGGTVGLAAEELKKRRE
jgi:hypothetical protein